MSKDVDALVIIGHSHAITEEAHGYTYEDIGQGLWYVRGGRTKWFNNQTITEEEKNNLFAGEVFLGLGRIAASCYLQQLPEHEQGPNPFRVLAIEVFDEISPFETGEALRTDFAIKWPSMELTRSGLPEMFDAALAADPTIEDILSEKWHKAQEVYKRRGRVLIEAYDADALFEGFAGLNLEQIAPDEVEFDEALNVVSQAHNLGELADRTGVRPQLAEVPYYQTFDRDNGEEMLASALEDLRLVSEAIKQ